MKTSRLKPAGPATGPKRNLSVRHSKFILFVFILTLLCESCSKDAPPKPAGTDLSPIKVAAGWEITSIPKVSIVNDIAFISNSDGFMIDGNDSTAINHSTDGGLTWVLAPINFADYWYNLQFLDSQTGFIQGRHSIAYTRDGGQTWTQKQLPSSDALSFRFTGTSTGYYCDLFKGVFRTTNSGDNWQNKVLTSGRLGTGEFVSFPTPEHGFLVSDGNGVYRSADSGETWDLVSESFYVDTVPTKWRPTFNQLQFVDDSVGYYGRADGLYKSINGGKDWKQLLPSTNAVVSCIKFFDPSNGYYSDDKKVQATHDGGKTWLTTMSSDSVSFISMNFTDSLHGWIGTDKGQVIRKQ